MRSLQARWRALLGGGLLAVLSFSSATQAAAAPWYWWRSTLNGEQHCAQSSPGPGWERGAGPFKDAACSKPGRPGR